MVGVVAMANENDTDPTIEVRDATLAQTIEVWTALEPPPPRPSESELKAEKSSETVLPELRAAVLKLLRAARASRHKEPPGST